MSDDLDDLLDVVLDSEVIPAAITLGADAAEAGVKAIKTIGDAAAEASKAASKKVGKAAQEMNEAGAAAGRAATGQARKVTRAARSLGGEKKCQAYAPRGTVCKFCGKVHA